MPKQIKTVYPLVTGKTVWWTHYWIAGNNSGTHRLPFLLRSVDGENATVINNIGFVSGVKTCDLSQGESSN